MGELLRGSFLFLLTFLHLTYSSSRNKTTSPREDKFLSVFTVVKFPNDACGSTSGLNGTCYTSSQCETLGGTSSGSCASSFGVCCVFDISCGGSSSQNNTYVTMTSYSTSSDKDPCTYTFCKSNSDICKLRIDFETMVIAGPVTYVAVAPFDAANHIKLGWDLGDCNTDTMTVTNPGGAVPPVICGYNTGQHMWVPANDACNQINFDIDTGSTATTRTWQIKVTQFECNDFMAPEQDCLQWHTADSGRIASFNFDTTAASTTDLGDNDVHLSSQNYDICIRRKRNFCQICYTAVIIVGTGIAMASSFGLGSSSVITTEKAAVGSYCSGFTVSSTTEANNLAAGDYLSILNLQAGTATGGTAGTIGDGDKLCGGLVNAQNGIGVAQATICSFATPFRVGVNMDANEAVFLPLTTAHLDKTENAASTNGDGRGFLGFWLDYWQVAC